MPKLERAGLSDVAPVNSPAMSPEAKLLQICARRELDENLEVALEQSVRRITDWDALLLGARRNYLVPLLAAHIVPKFRGEIPAPIMDSLSLMVQNSALHALQLARIQEQLVKRVLEPNSVPHAFVKGASLAEWFYGDAQLRQYRDIDVLVAPDRIADVGIALLDTGYRIVNSSWKRFRLGDVRSFCRYHSALELRSPEGILIELHKTLDEYGCVFSTNELLERATLLRGARREWQTLRVADHFVYLCYHHSRHRWSSLHWVADLDAVCRHPDFNQREVERVAGKLGLASTVAESILLGADIYRLALPDGGRQTSTESRFLPDCRDALNASLAFVAEGPSSADPDDVPEPREPDFRYPWQRSFGFSVRFWLFRWRPSVNDFNAWPLPLRLHGVYWFTRPLRLLVSRLQKWKAGGATRKGPVVRVD